mmetsp:Transcript_9957/g.31637  ORF Transcript_9957/g.31637 Transcript_9957/m.31637 type:complete len:620 (-) Transcript_9957:59-1918(-)
MDALNLHVDQAAGVHIDGAMLLHPSNEAHLAALLRRGPLLLESLVVLELADAPDEGEVLEPSITAKRLRDEPRELRVGAMDPSARRDPIRAVHELPRLAALDGPLVEVGEGLPLHDLRVHRRHAVDVVRADDGDVAHPYLLVAALALHLPYHRHVHAMCAVAPLRPDLLEEEVVHEEHDLEVPGQEVAEEGLRPLLESLGHHRVVGVVEDLLRQPPGVRRLQALHVDEQAHQLGDRDRRVRVVELDLHLAGEQVPTVGVPLLEAPQDVLDGGAAEHVLLAQAQLLARLVVVVRVEEVVELVRTLLRRHGAEVLTSVELLKVQLLGRQRVPEAEVDAIVGPVARHRVVVGHGLQDLAAAPAGALLASRVRVAFDVAVEADAVGHVLARDLEAIRAGKPIVRHLHLPPVDDLLLKQAVVVPDAVAPEREVLGRARVQEARREAAEAPVAEGRVRLVVVELLELEAQLLHGLAVVLLDVQVGERVLQVAADQVLRGQVVTPLRVLLLEVGVGVVEGLDQTVAHGQRHGPVAGLLLEVEPGARQGVLDVVHHGPLDPLGGVGQVGLHHLAELLVLPRALLGACAGVSPLHLAGEERERALAPHLEAVALRVRERRGHGAEGCL